MSGDGGEVPGIKGAPRGRTGQVRRAGWDLKGAGGLSQVCERKGVVRLGHGTSKGLEGKTASFT